MIGPGQQQPVRFPNLGKHDIIVPGTARLTFTITLNSPDPNRTLIQNIGRAIVKKTTVKILGNEILSIDDSNLYHCHNDLWKTTKKRQSAHYQGIDTSENRNTTRIQINAGNKDEAVLADKAIADAFGNYVYFFIPLDFEIIETHMPFHARALGDRL